MRTAVLFEVLEVGLQLLVSGLKRVVGSTTTTESVKYTVFLESLFGVFVLVCLR